MEIGAHDMGQGAWTALAQIAADGLGLDLDQVEFRSGTSDLPDAGIAGGSAHTATAGMAIHNAGADVIAKLADLATGDERSPLFGAGNAGVVARDGRLFRRDDESAQRELCRYPRPRRPRARSRPAATAPPTRRRSRTTPCMRTARCSPRSRSIPISARSASPAWSAPSRPGGSSIRGWCAASIYGGMIWGVSFALHEHAVIDRRSGRIMNANLGEYHVPVNADVPSLEAILVEEHDPHVNALGIKGVGEIGITGLGRRGRQRGLARDRRPRAPVSDPDRRSADGNLKRIGIWQISARVRGHVSLAGRASSSGSALSSPLGVPGYEAATSRRRFRADGSRTGPPILTIC